MTTPKWTTIPPPFLPSNPLNLLVLKPNEICLIALPAAKPPKPKASVGTKPLLPITTPKSIAIEPQTTEGVSRFKRTSRSVFPHDKAGAMAIINNNAKPIGVDIFTK